MTRARFAHDPVLRARFPGLRVRTLIVSGLEHAALEVLDSAPHLAAAGARLADGTEAEQPAIRAWRAAYAEMGLKPTQTRCAAEALLRRLRLDGALPRLGPVVDFCNAVSAAFAIPLAVFDLDRIAGDLTVTFARGDEVFVTFSGATETPEPGELIFRDAAGRAHARRWAHRQGAEAAVSAETSHALLVAEALHEDAEAELSAIAQALVVAFEGTGARIEPGSEWTGAQGD